MLRLQQTSLRGSSMAKAPCSALPVVAFRLYPTLGLPQVFLSLLIVMASVSFPMDIVIWLHRGHFFFFRFFASWVLFRAPKLVAALGSASGQA